ncbi:AgmX/PglI C-terminal domain-containing protein [bacterium]|nr:AgmX/PglI C-terminal domain-containing protein [bacterium]
MTNQPLRMEAIMNAQTISFPSELNRGWSDILDREMLIIFGTVFLFIFGFTFYMQSLPPREMTAEEMQRLLSTIYQAEPVPVEQRVKTPPSEQRRETRVVAPDEAPPTVAERNEARQERHESVESRRASMMRAAQSVGIFNQAGGVPSGNRRGVSGTTLEGGGLTGVEASALSGVARTTQVARVKKARAGGAILEGAGGISISEMSVEDIDLLLAESDVQTEALPSITVETPTTGARDPESVMSVVSQHERALRHCYNTQKKKDPNLRGRVTVRYMILADGTVRNVQTVNTSWSNTRLGRSVEDCIRRRVARWGFPQADADLTVEFNLLLV